MRNILVDEARRRARRKQGGSAQPADLHAELAIDDGPTIDVLALDEALHDLEASHQRPAQVVMFRYFAGLDFEQIRHGHAEQLSRGRVGRDDAQALGVDQPDGMHHGCDQHRPGAERIGRSGQHGRVRVGHHEASTSSRAGSKK